ncbi:MAG: DUF5683 domain-containing protein [bacterium]|nr:DUF5683 domain-containing protein [bacterium]MDD5756837.1 DUF5683 domain-containing protein [bacterium]
MFSCKHGLRILVLALAGIMLLSISAVSAREAVSNFNSHTPGNAALRSLMLPGWGQFFNGQPTKGYIFAGAEIVAIGAAVMMNSSANSIFNEYETQRTQTLYNDYSSKVDTANMFVYAAAAIWVGNVIDAYFSADSGTSTKTKKSSAIKKSTKKKKVIEEEVEEEPAEEEETMDEEEEEEEEIKPLKKQKKQVEEEIEEEEEEPAEEEEEYEEEDESRSPERGFYLQAKGLNELGIVYRFTF